MSLFLLVLRGALLGVAALVPGVSGGTIALLTNIYERLIDAFRSFNATAIASFFTLRWRRFFSEVHWAFLCAVGGGALAAMIALAPLVRYLLNHGTYHTYLYATFFGVILGSIYFCARRLHSWKWPTWVALVVGFVLAYLINAVSMEPSTGRDVYEVPLTLAKLEQVEGLADASNYSLATEVLSNVSPSELATMQLKGLVLPEEEVFSVQENRRGPAEEFVKPDAYGGFNFRVMAAGIVASWALLLPGISGAYVLHLLGFYSDAIANFTLLTQGVMVGHFSGDALLFVFSLLIGLVVGVLAFSHIIGALLKSFHTVTMALLIGFMAGALRAVWPWWSYQWHLNPLRLDYGLEIRLLHPIWPDTATLPFWIAIVWLLGALLVTVLLEAPIRRR